MTKYFCDACGAAIKRGDNWFRCKVEESVSSNVKTCLLCEDCGRKMADLILNAEEGDDR